MLFYPHLTRSCSCVSVLILFQVLCDLQCCHLKVMLCAASLTFDLSLCPLPLLFCFTDLTYELTMRSSDAGGKISRAFYVRVCVHATWFEIRGMVWEQHSYARDQLCVYQVHVVARTQSNHFLVKHQPVTKNLWQPNRQRKILLQSWRLKRCCLRLLFLSVSIFILHFVFAKFAAGCKLGALFPHRKKDSVFLNAHIPP